MWAKTYRAAELEDALARVRAELGSQALILNQGQRRQSRWWPFGKRVWEVVATVVEVDDSPARETADQTARLADQNARIATQLADLRTDVARLTRAANLNRLPDASTTLVQAYDWMCSRGLAPEVAQELVVSTGEELDHIAQTQPDRVEAALRRQLEQRIRVRPAKATPGRGPLVVFLVGQAGVGKTTSLVKLAVRQILNGGRSVALINADAERPGAAAQVDALTKGLKIEHLLATGPDMVRETILSQAQRDLLLVDTPGCNPHRATQMEELKALTRVAPRRSIFLVISALTTYQEMQNQIQAFSAIGPHGLILTHLDETSHLGPAVTLACQTEVPVAYLCSGRRTHEDLVPATPAGLVAWFWGESAPTKDAPAGDQQAPAPPRTQGR